jgi:hypothetical protein
MFALFSIRQSRSPKRALEPKLGPLKSRRINFRRLSVIRIQNRLGKFLLIGRLFTFRNFFVISDIIKFQAFLFMKILYIHFVIKIRLATFWAIFSQTPLVTAIVVES